MVASILKHSRWFPTLFLKHSQAYSMAFSSILKTLSRSHCHFEAFFNGILKHSQALTTSILKLVSQVWIVILKHSQAFSMASSSVPDQHFSSIPKHSQAFSLGFIRKHSQAEAHILKHFQIFPWHSRMFSVAFSSIPIFSSILRRSWQF